MTPYQAYMNGKQNHPSGIVFVKVNDRFHTYNDDALGAAELLGIGAGTIQDPDDGGLIIPHLQLPEDVEACARKLIIAGKRIIMVEPQ